ncbi:MAG TPA: CRISPR-associated helicase/endonuclease Cas3, partial [Candidatus Enterocloster faecavium]|nr:CRISPR-associated helicase/endonuclease Cas3 [Candidatus Enterocloster faecavium]
GAEELLAQIRQQGYSKSVMRRAQQYCIQVYDRDFEKLYGAGMVREVSADIEDFFELVKESQYTEDMGLDLGVELGMAVVL